MTPRQKKRMSIVLLLLTAVSLAVMFTLQAFRQGISYFIEPSSVVINGYDVNTYYRLGGLVKEESFVRHANGVTLGFAITDCSADILVEFTGLLPDLFREGQGIIASGRFNSQGVFIADQVLAKHDENYVPPELAETMLKKQQQQCESVERIG